MTERTAEPTAQPAPRDSRKPLTQRQFDVLMFVIDSIRDRGYAPTLREIGEKMEIASTNGVTDHLIALERKGYIRRDAMASRTIVVLFEPPRTDEQELQHHRERAEFHRMEAARIEARIELDRERTEAKRGAA